MPRVTYLKTAATRTSAAHKRLEGVAKIIRGECGNSAQLSRTAGVSQPTAQKWLQHPEKLTLEQLIQICVAYDIPCEDVKAKISW